MPCLKLQAFKITLSFKTDVTQEMIKWLLRWLDGNTIHRYVVTELDKSGKEHLHACVIWNTKIAGNTLKDRIWTYGYMKYQRDDSVRRVAIKINVLYDNKWYQEYLRKDPNRELLEDEWPKQSDQLEPYYPSKEEQKTCQAIGKAGVARNGNLHMCEAFSQWCDAEGVEYDPIAAGEWLNRYYMDRHIQFDRKKWREQHELLIRTAWNKWRLTEWQKAIAREHGGYSGGGYGNLADNGATVFKDTPESSPDALHIQGDRITEAQGEQPGSSGLQQEEQEEPLYSTSQDEQVHEESDCASEIDEEV